ncbi:MAG: hypothetical protein J7K73_01685 [Nanoarchaeota archaeon]|nr:hypothetical protein [Nanoarchaeota archaeon]
MKRLSGKNVDSSYLRKKAIDLDKEVLPPLVHKIEKKTDTSSIIFKVKKEFWEIIGYPIPYITRLEESLTKEVNSTIDNLLQDTYEIFYKTHRGDTFYDVLREYVDPSLLAEEGTPLHKAAQEKRVEPFGDAAFLLDIITEYSGELAVT